MFNKINWRLKTSINIKNLLTIIKNKIKKLKHQ
jgi:hypothetical protein